MECILCKIQFVEKAETAFNAGLVNHMKMYAIQNLSLPICISEKMDIHSKLEFSFYWLLQHISNESIGKGNWKYVGLK